MPSITYDDATLFEIRRLIKHANDDARSSAELAEVSRQTAAKQAQASAASRARARQFEALLAHAEGRYTEHAETALETERTDKQRAALTAALHLIDAGLPTVHSWDIDNSGLKIQLLGSFFSRDHDRQTAYMNKWAEFLAAEINTTDDGSGWVVHRVNAVYLDVPVEVRLLASSGATNGSEAGE